ncbi:pyridoxamine 5'-phosphate oxidase family protein [Penaeicola halotolerans]|uniref:pyridoxamine 5'-phosphate oxidase family protein n=1 Tax=Penaeicola halotolerans TaxID=2793196 RepID=UPI001CF88F8F|nr:pyridoxamine 5'-phosphate oxidase family protein [Penaeicola halotolerans]
MPLIKPEDSLETIFNTIKHELHRAYLDKKHPFRYVNLATVGVDGVHQRLVVFRELSEDLKLTIYTDIRSEKVVDINFNPRVSLLLYHPQKQVQIRMEGHAGIHHRDELTHDRWQRVQGDARKSYGTILAPGTGIKQSTYDDYLTENEGQYFAVISIQISTVELLQLNRGEHIRVKYEKSATNWVGQWLVP